MAYRQVAIGIVGIVAGIALGTILFPIATSAQKLTFNTVRDCDNTAVISCGALSSNELLKAYDSNSSVRSLYTSVGISNYDMQNLNESAEAGYVTPGGKVILSNSASVVASNIVVFSLANLPKSTVVQNKGLTFYLSTAKQIIANKNADAFVYLHDNHFQFAILASNGNPVINPTRVSSLTKQTAKTTTTQPKKLANTSPNGTSLVNTGPNENTVVLLFIGTTILGITFSYLSKRRIAAN